MRYFLIGLVLALLVLRLLRSRWGARLLGVSQQALDRIYVVALVLVGTVAALTEYWLVLAVIGLLLIWRVLEGLRARQRQRSASPQR
ncbi:MAG TPA: hypothetical protein H9837_01085 [Candidatus Brachybacterium merdigallinarum]|nr:hypothetical protein [Candidatus Brachybacterium merdigallinarum]